MTIHELLDFDYGDNGVASQLIRANSLAGPSASSFLLLGQTWNVSSSATGSIPVDETASPAQAPGELRS